MSTGRRNKPASSDAELHTWVHETFNRLTRLKYEEIAKKCDVVYLKPRDKDQRGRFIINLLNRTLTVELSNGEVLDLISGKNVGVKLSYVVLEYLVNGDGSKVSGAWSPLIKGMTSQELVNYFKKMVLRPFLQTFGYERERFEAAASSLGGRRERLGGVGFSFPFLPRIRVLLQLWTGDVSSYTQPAANVSISSNTLNYLSYPAVVYACETLVAMLRKAMEKPS
ncbi:MAG TPA: DUF3786 domain-containing protein [Candidatus Caldiarchaeum subterraneum]|uniref:DUF3786 domain-containing protein n=1 Tax=Caldiarchaeum subterraneum TaxID=311458 RepID=A0A832ZUG2_CALS0|nr:DUF3786 domain-containing protein [Aigarchaeota archaeon]HIQ29213.1 DUF3786 domain-containing protein [Candidatus Caldarchaeum subterraneum]